MIALDQQALFRPHLQPGEGLIWVGRPPRGIVFARSDLLNIPFALFWNYYVGRMSLLIWTNPAPLVVRLLLVLFLLVGLHMLPGRFLRDAWVRHRLAYAVTSRRVLILRKGRRPRLRSWPLAALPAFVLEEHGGGRGTIAFEAGAEEETTPLVGHGLAPGRRASYSAPCFYDIAGARAVHDFIRREAEWHRGRAIGTGTARGGFAVRKAGDGGED